MYACIDVMYLCLNKGINVCMHVSLYTCACMRVCITGACMQAHTYVQTLYVYMHVRTV
jgi:hypothetical protein